MNSDRYNKLSVFLRDKFGGRVEKICVDGGFSCPNRDGGGSGCLFCGEKGAAEDRQNFDSAVITRQVHGFFKSRPKNGAEKFIIYFQNFSNTYADTAVLKQRYDAALVSDGIVALAVATRADCVTEENASLIASYSDKYYVWTELGLQTSNEATAELINRGYGNDCFTRAAGLLSSRGVDVVCHLIFGLPGETDADIAETVDFVNRSKVSGVKMHSLYVTRGTGLYDMYESGAYSPQTMDDYVRRLAYAVTHLRKDIIIHRITGDCPRGALVAPLWNNRKKQVRNALEKMLEKNGWTQGCFATRNA